MLDRITQDLVGLGCRRLSPDNRTKKAMRAKFIGYCLNCRAQLSFCGKPFTDELTCRFCGAINVYEESQQPARLKLGRLENL